MSVCEKCGLPACGNECLGEIRDDILHASYGSRTSNRRVIDDLESKLAEANFDKRYLSDQLAAVTKERDELREHLSRACDVLDEISGKTCRLGCHKHATKALIRIERDALPILIDSEDK